MTSWSLWALKLSASFVMVNSSPPPPSLECRLYRFTCKQEFYDGLYLCSEHEISAIILENHL